MSESVDPAAAIDRLRDRVDALELEFKEKKKPFYKAPAVVISALAVIVSIGFNLWGTWGTSQATIRSKKEELRKIIVDLIEFGEAASKLAQPDGTAPAAATAAWTAVRAGTRRHIYLGAADDLVRQIPDEVTYDQYTFLGLEHAADGTFKTSETYHLRAAKAAPSPILKAQALREVAALWFWASPYQDVDKGRRYFQEALDALNSVDPVPQLHLVGVTYEFWAMKETLIGARDPASEKRELARKAYAALPTNYWGRDDLVRNLDDRVSREQSVRLPPYR